LQLSIINLNLALKKAVQYFVNDLNAADVITLFMITALGTVNIFFANRIPTWQMFLVQDAAMLAFIGVSIWLGSLACTGWKMWRLFSLAFVIPIIFNQCVHNANSLNPNYLDAWFIRADETLFGVLPTHWLYEHFANPILTEWLQWTYASFYFLSAAVGYVLLRKNDKKNFEIVLFVTLYGFFLTYFGYFFTPVAGPRFTLHNIATINDELPGVWLAVPIRDAIASVGMLPDCCPSGHTDLTIIALVMSYRYSRKTFWVLLPVGISVIFATVYMRYHYVTDVLIGMVYCAFTLATAAPFKAWLDKQIALLKAAMVQKPQPMPACEEKIMHEELVLNKEEALK
jgi:membrane-associated phospholipid phosphatase